MVVDLQSLWAASELSAYYNTWLKFNGKYSQASHINYTMPEQNEVNQWTEDFAGE